jgi:hypothetical protein
MQQRFRRLAVFFGAASLAGAGLIVVACGTDNGEAVATPQVEAGKDTGGGKTDTGTPVDPDGGTVVDGNAPDCSNEAELRTNTPTSGIFCAFYRRDGGAPGDSGLGQSYCENDDTCCNPAKVGATFPASYCADGKGADKCAAAAAANNSTWTPDAGTAWECSDKNSCGGGQVCCFIQDQARLAADPGDKLNPGGYGNNNPQHPPACNGKAMYNVGGTRCTTGSVCPAGEYIVCSKSDDTCGAGTKCTAVEAQFRDLGYCAPTN